LATRTAGRGFEVVDSHVHIFPPEFSGMRSDLLGREGWFGALYENPRAPLIDADGLIEAMDAAGVAHALLCGFPWVDLGLCREHNAYMANAARRFPRRLSWLGIAPPGQRGALKELEDCFRAGAVGIGELNADAQGFDWREADRLRPVIELCRGAGRPLLLHASEPIGHRYPGKGTATPDKLVSFLAEAQEITVVAAHWGGGLPFYELMPEVASVTRNVVYDSAASTYLYRPAVFRTVLDLVGPEQVLFGSDYPVLRMDRFLESVDAIVWRDEAERRNVLGGNARRVFGIDLEGTRT
jgi:uncharacterized protein